MSGFFCAIAALAGVTAWAGSCQPLTGFPLVGVSGLYHFMPGVLVGEELQRGRNNCFAGACQPLTGFSLVGVSGLYHFMVGVLVGEELQRGRKISCSVYSLDWLMKNTNGGIIHVGDKPIHGRSTLTNGLMAGTTGRDGPRGLPDKKRVPGHYWGHHPF